MIKVVKSEKVSFQTDLAVTQFRAFSPLAEHYIERSELSGIEAILEIVKGWEQILNERKLVLQNTDVIA